MRTLFHATFCAFCLASFLSNSAEARPRYLGNWTDQYATKMEAYASSEFVEVSKSVKCMICHYGRSKENRNHFGRTIQSFLTKENEDDEETILDALTAASRVLGRKIREGEAINKVLFESDELSDDELTVLFQWMADYDRAQDPDVPDSSDEATGNESPAATPTPETPAEVPTEATVEASASEPEFTVDASDNDSPSEFYYFAWIGAIGSIVGIASAFITHGWDKIFHLIATWCVILFVLWLAGALFLS